MSDHLVRVFKYRLLPRKAQHARLREALEHTRELYNAALQERIEAYRKAALYRSYRQQAAALTELRTESAYRSLPVSLQRWPLKKLDLAFAAFFARVRRGDKPGFPRYRGQARYSSFGFTDKSGWKVDGTRLYMLGIGRVRLHLHRPLPDTPLSCQIRRDAGGWVALLACAVEPEALPHTGRSIGVDLGITSFAALSDGSAVPGLKAARRAQRELRRRQRAVSRSQRGSHNRQKARVVLQRHHERVANTRRTFHHQIAARLVRENDLIAIEDLKVVGLAQGVLARDINDAGWASFTSLLCEKAERAGRTVVRVNPAYTSQTCPDCGTVKPKALTERTHRCDCGCELDRDVAAAKVILMRAVVRPLSLNVGGHAVRAA